MKFRHFRTRKWLWVLASIFAFVLCWLYPMHFGKEGSYPLGRLWLDFVRGAYAAWLPLVILCLVFGIVAVLVGFAVQALLAVVQDRIAQPQRGADGSQPSSSTPIPPSAAGGS